MLVTMRNPFDGKDNTIDLPITEEQFDRWRDGMLVQRAFPQLNADEREFLISGIPPGKWDEYMGKDEEVDFEY